MKYKEAKECLFSKRGNLVKNVMEPIWGITKENIINGVVLGWGFQSTSGCNEDSHKENK